MERRSGILCKIQDEFLTCNICCEYFEDPRLLPCQHVICWKCLDSYVNGKSIKNDAFLCPFCKEPVQIPKRGLSNVSKCLYVRQLKDALPNTDILCHKCGQTDGHETYLCMDCCTYYCVTCILWHSEHTHHKDLKISYLDKRFADMERNSNENKSMISINFEVFSKEIEELKSSQELFKSDLREIVAKETRTQELMTETISSIKQQLQTKEENDSKKTKSVKKNSAGSETEKLDAKAMLQNINENNEKLLQNIDRLSLASESTEEKLESMEAQIHMLQSQLSNSKTLLEKLDFENFLTHVMIQESEGKFTRSLTTEMESIRQDRSSMSSINVKQFFMTLIAIVVSIVIEKCIFG